MSLMLYHLYGACPKRKRLVPKECEEFLTPFGMTVKERLSTGNRSI